MSAVPEPPLNISRKIDALSLEFEQAFQTSDSFPSIESYLARWDESESYLRNLFEELLRIELEARVRNQETLVFGGYLTRFPDHREAIQNVFAEFVAHEADYELDPTRPHPKKTADGDLPDVIGRYQIQEKIGEGSYGVVYRAHDPELNCSVAIKQLNIARMLRDNSLPIVPTQLVQNLLKEARLMAQLRKYEGIVAILDVLTISNHNSIEAIYCVQEFIDGGDLKKRLADGVISPTETARILKLVARAMGRVHEHGIYHRDLKPANIILDSQGNPFVTDFGLAVDTHLQQRSKGEVAGTLQYMSPEQTRGEVHLFDGRTDVWALGVIMYEMLTGHRPFSKQSTFLQASRDICQKEPKPLRSYSPHLPAELERICLKCLSKRMTDRYPTATDLSQDLLEWLTEYESGKEPLRTSDPAKIKVIPKGLRSFDANDAEIYPELLPGTRDRHGLPDSLSFWKRKVEEKDSDQTFRIGVLYGPSGSGKSSFVKAGLLPRLNQVIPVYVESTANDTEARLVRKLRKSVPQLPLDLSLPEVVIALRESPQLTGFKKTIIILDQFEQWLQSRRAYGREQLIEALRQCDGSRVQTLILIRDDFWMAATRFMQELEVDMVPGENIAAVDLFPPDHAIKVLTEFGRGYGKLEDEAEPTRKQKQFLEKVVEGLAIDGKIVCVRLAIFAEMVKQKDWIPSTIDAVGGTTGIGESFLEESFSSDAANPLHRRHEPAARAVLQSLLPELGTNLKGYMKSREQLLLDSGYEESAGDFAELINILDGKLRLITPTDPDGAADGTLGDKSTNYFQLTHDYLVRPLRDWLTRKQRSTQKGRVQLLLSELAESWQIKPEPRNLPSVLEWFSIIRWTRRSERTQLQQEMVSASTNRLAKRALMSAIVLIGLVFGVFQINGHIRSSEAVSRLMTADTGELPEIMPSIVQYERWSKSMLDEQLTRLSENPIPASPEDADRATRAMLHLELARSVLDPAQTVNVLDRLQDVPVEHLKVVSKLLQPHTNQISEDLWKRYETTKTNEDDLPLRFFAVLAGLTTDDSRWETESETIVDEFMSVRSADAAYWRALLRPVKSSLAPALVEQLVEKDQLSTSQRSMLLDLITEYAADSPELLVKAIEHAESEELGPLLSALERHPEEGLRLVQTRLADLEPKPIVIDPVAIVGEELAKEIVAAEGLVAQDGVMIQRISRTEFDALDDRLEQKGFTANCVRPYYDGDGLYVAAVWIRADDPKLTNSEIFWDLSLEEVKQLQISMAEKDANVESKYIPVDFARYHPPISAVSTVDPTVGDTDSVPIALPASDSAEVNKLADTSKWVVVWRTGADEAGETRFLPEISLAEFRDQEEHWPEERWAIARFHVWMDSQKQPQVSLIWNRIEQVNAYADADWRYDRGYGDLRPGKLQTDLRVDILPADSRDELGIHKHLSEALYAANSHQPGNERNNYLSRAAKYSQMLGQTKEPFDFYIELLPHLSKTFGSNTAARDNFIHQSFALLFARTRDKRNIAKSINQYSSLDDADSSIISYLRFREAVVNDDTDGVEKHLEELMNSTTVSDDTLQLQIRALAVGAMYTTNPKRKEQLQDRCLALIEKTIQSGKLNAEENLFCEIDLDSVRKTPDFKRLTIELGFHRRTSTSYTESIGRESQQLWRLHSVDHRKKANDMIESGFQPAVVTVQHDSYVNETFCSSLWYRRPEIASKTIMIAKRTAHLLISAAKLGTMSELQSAALDSRNPDLRSRLILYAPQYISEVQVAKLCLSETDPSKRQALVLMLGAISLQSIDEPTRSQVLSLCRELTNSPETGLRSAAGWCLKQWGDSAKASIQINESPHIEFHAPNNHRMLVIIPPDKFLMGSPPWEAARDYRESLHWERIPRNYAMSATPTTKGQFREFLKDEKVRLYYGVNVFSRFDVSPSPDPKTDDLPVGGVSWRDVALYCQWLSEKDPTVDSDHHCYPQIWDPRSTDLPKNYLELNGYRLPTESEWEWASRCNPSQVKRYCGNDDHLLTGFEWCDANSRERSHPVGQLRPNQLGFFDLLGNVGEWCDDSYEAYHTPLIGDIRVDAPGNKKLPKDDEDCVIRGGSFASQPELLRSANRSSQLAQYRSRSIGFRVTKTVTVRSSDHVSNINE